MDADDVRWIAFVTRRFHELQGLMTAAAGAGLLAGCVLCLQLPGLNVKVAPQLGFLVVMSGMVFLPRHYRATYGEVAPAGNPPQRFPWILLVVQLSLFVDQLTEGRLPISAVALGLACYSVAVLMRDFRWRPYYVAGPIAAIAALVAPAIRPTGREPHLDVFLASCAFVGLALLVVGLFDHLLLAASLGGPDRTRLRGAVDGVAARVRMASRGPRGWFALGLVLAVAVHLLTFGWPTGPKALVRLLVIPFGLGLSVPLLRSSLQRLAPEVPAVLPILALDDVLMAMALGSAVILDAFLPAGVPSVLALAIAAASLRVVVRDWPLRGYYLIGAASATFSAFQHLFVGSDSDQLRWFTMFLLLVCAPLAIEALLDYRLARSLSAPEPTGGLHADAL